jgi:hypothetical protein
MGSPAASAWRRMPTSWSITALAGGVGRRKAVTTGSPTALATTASTPQLRSAESGTSAGIEPRVAAR